MAEAPKVLHSDLKEFMRIQKKTRPAGSHPAAKAMLKKPRTVRRHIKWNISAV
ncbi:hypothetical protein [Halovulum sp. GXIMD14793]